jgi:hypothetical protein
MKDTGKINILKKLAEIADELDIKGLRKEANAVTNVMSKVAEQVQPYSGYKQLSNALQQPAPVQSQPAPVQSQPATVQSQIEERKEAGGGYTSSTADFQNTIDYAVKNNLTVRQMYDYAYQHRGGDQKAGNYANNLIAKYRTIHPDPDTAPVKAVKLTGTSSDTSSKSTPSPTPGVPGSDINQTQENFEFTPMASRKKNSIFMKTSQGAQDPTFQYYENVIVNDIQPLFQSAKLSYDNCYRFSGNPFKQDETLKYGNEFLDKIQTIVTKVNDLLNTKKLTKANQLNFKKAVFGFDRKDSPFAKVNAIKQIAINVSDFVLGSGGRSGDAPKLVARAEELLQQMQSV